MRSLIYAALLVLAGISLGACATTPPAASPPVVVEKKKTKRPKAKKPPAVVEEPAPVVVEAPAEEVPPEPPPPESDIPWEEGMASFYADSLAGNRTANGERYRIDRRTCAHRTLPFGTVLEVYAPSTGRSTTCRVNDRGPFAKQRVLDVSKKCARELNMIDAGVLRVKYRQTPGSGDPE